MDGTVLIADDDRTIRTVLTQALTRAGCRVHATGSLAQLSKWVEEGRGDLVITDVMMPDGNGIDRIPAIREMRPDLPVIVISAQNTIVTAIRATEAEAFEYLPKALRSARPDEQGGPGPRAPAAQVGPGARAAAHPARGRGPRDAADRARALDAGAVPDGGAGAERRPAGAHRRRGGRGKDHHRPQFPRAVGPARARAGRADLGRCGGRGDRASRQRRRAAAPW